LSADKSDRGCHIESIDELATRRFFPATSARESAGLLRHRNALEPSTLGDLLQDVMNLLLCIIPLYLWSSLLAHNERPSHTFRPWSDRAEHPLIRCTPPPLHRRI